MLTLICILALHCLLLCDSLTSVSRAQITLDGTVGPSGPLVGPDYVIGDDLGQLKGTNLFHSFGEFNVLTGESATFTGPDSVGNVIGRITGGHGSAIDGLIRSAIPDANLFLLNPWGFMFGPNATLDVNGSFHVSTADYVKFSDGGVFYADPSKGSVLTVAPPSAFGFLGDTPGNISIEGSFLETAEAETLSLVGGDITIVGGTLFAPGGRINLVSGRSPGELSLAESGSPIDSFETMGEIAISQQSLITASGQAPGSMFIKSGRLVMKDSVVGMANLGDLPDGDIDIQLTEALEMEGGLLGTATTADGSGGNINIETGTLTLSGGAQIGTSTSTDAQGGNVSVSAADAIAIAGRSSNGFRSALYSTKSGGGSGGDIMVTTPTLSVSDDGAIFAENLATESSAPENNEKGGDLTIETETLTVSSGAQVGTGTFGNGPAGDVTVTATDTLSISGKSTDGVRSALYSQTGGAGNSGNVLVTASTASIYDQGAIFNISRGEGLRGDITLNAKDFALTGDGVVFGADIILNADTIEISDGAYIRSKPSADGDGEVVRITATDSITIHGGGELIGPWRGESSVPYTGIFTDAFISDSGSAGNLFVSAPTVTVTNSGQISARTYTDARGGDITVEAENIVLLSGGQIAANSAGSSLFNGPAGNVFVTATESILMSGENGELSSGIRSTTRSDASAGRIVIVTPLLSVSDAAKIAVATGIFGEGDAGEIVIDVGRLELLSGGGISSSSSGSGEEGSIQVSAEESVLIDDGFIVSFGMRSGAAGNIEITTPSLEMVDGTISTETVGIRKGGDILIDVDNLSLEDASLITSKSSDFGDAGNITITVSDTFRSEDSFVTTEATQADGGNIQINAQYMVYLIDSEITAAVGGGSETVGGNIMIDPEYVILKGSSIVANAFEGRGGNIRISAGTFLADPESRVDASSALGIDGNVDIRAPVVNISGILAPLPKGFLRAAELLQEPCAARIRGGTYSSFIIGGRDGLPMQPDGLLPSPML
jgi:filamentous hemagglutinin family protein